MKFQANTFDEMAELSKKHGMQMFHNRKKEHMVAMNKMQELMQRPDDMQKWFVEKRKEF